MNEVSSLPTRHKLDTDTYFRMAELGLLGETPRVELIDGDIIDMAPIGQNHYSTVNRLTQNLVLAFQRRAIVSVQNPAQLDRYSAPQPDLAVFRHREDFYRSGTPAGPADTLLLIEVADSSLYYDRTVKLALYAKAGIPEYWIVDLENRRLEVYRKPGPDGFAEKRTYAKGDSLTLSQAPDIEIGLDAVLG